MSKPKILFVDDDIKLLSGLRRMLHSQSNKWDMYFCNSGAEALEIIKDQEICVVVSDMRMPTMDGAELLTRILKQQPNAIRIILSGYAEMATVLRTIGPSHQYLAKPCEHELLKERISIAISVMAENGKKDLREIVSGLVSLPMQPDTLRCYSAELAQPEPDINEIISIVKRDIAIYIQLTKLTNSAYFGLPKKINDVDAVVKLLGYETLRCLLTVDGFLAAFEGNDSQQGQLTALNNKVNLMRQLSKQICLSSGLDEVDAKLADDIAALSSIGAMILLCYRSVQYDAHVALIETEGMSKSCAENKVFGATFFDVSAYLLSLWGFSKNMIDLVLGLDAPYEIKNVITPQSAVKISAAILQRHQALERSDPDAERYALEVVFGNGNLAADQISLWETMYEKLIHDPH